MPDHPIAPPIHPPIHPLELSPGGLATGPLTVVRCTYCDAPIPARAFAFLTSTRKLLVTTCPRCQHPKTVTAVRWRRLGGRLELVTAR